MTATRRTSKPEAQRIKALSACRLADGIHLKEILSRPEGTVYPDLGFTAIARRTISEGKGIPERGRISSAVCERDLSPGSWRELLDSAQGLPAPPAVIVAARGADESYVAGVLNLRGYDVLAMPLIGRGRDSFGHLGVEPAAASRSVPRWLP